MMDELSHECSNFQQLIGRLAGLDAYRYEATLEEKSLGAIQKGGHAIVTQVLRYGERATRPGLTLLEAPGNDGISSTALVAAGANILLFTTGRGTPLGFPVPTLKISSNSALAANKAHGSTSTPGACSRRPTPTHSPMNS